MTYNVLMGTLNHIRSLTLLRTTKFGTVARGEGHISWGQSCANLKERGPSVLQIFWNPYLPPYVRTKVVSCVETVCN